MGDAQVRTANAVTGVNHIGVTVSCLDVARRFYLEGLGCEQVAAQRNSAPYLSLTGYDGVTIDAIFARVPGSEVILEIQEYQDLPRQPDPRSPGTSRAGSSHICLIVSDLDSAMTRLEDFGGRRVTDPVEIDRGINLGARAVYIRDPDGYTLELFEPSNRDES